MPLATMTIVPHLWFDNQAVEAAEFYCSVFPDSRILQITRLTDTPSGDVDAVTFELCGQRFRAISAGPYFQFNEAISFQIECQDQQEIDYYWQALSAVPEVEQCGWLKDKYGLSWQVVPTLMIEVMACGDAERIARVTQAFLKMKKFDLHCIQKAYRAG